MAQARDTYVSQAAPTTNYGERTKLVLSNAASASKRVLLWFPDPFRRVDERIAVTAATLTITTKAGWADSPTLTAKRITASWAEVRATYNNAPAVSATNAATATPTTPADGTAVTFDVTDMLQDVVDGEVWYGIEVSTNGTVDDAVYSSESVETDYRPSLEVSYLYSPDAPDNLHPDDTRAISNATPHLRWDFASQSDEDVTSQTYSRVRVSGAEVDLESGGTPTYDSGWVANTDQNFHLTAYPSGLVSGNTYFWDVQVRDQSGLDSDVSEIAEFRYFTGGTLTITSPVTNGDAVDDSTPVITWTFTGRTQQFVELALYKNDADVEGNLIYHIRRRASTATSWEIPADDDDGHPLIRKESPKVYIVEVTVWDDKNRGFADGVSKRRNFVWVNGEAAAPPVAPTVTLDGPSLLFEWTRSAEPDVYGLFDHDPDSDTYQELVAHIDATDAHGSGTSYSYRHYDVEPGQSYTFRLAARTDSSKWSNRVATTPATIEFSIIGKYVIDRRTEEYVHFLGDDDDPVTLGQTGETEFLLNRRDPVRILGGTRGWETTISGVIAGHEEAGNWVTARTWLRRFRKFMASKSVSGNLHVMYGTRSYRAIISDFEATQRPTGESIYDCRFNAVQVNDYDVDDD